MRKDSLVVAVKSRGNARDAGTAEAAANGDWHLGNLSHEDFAQCPERQGHIEYSIP